MTKPFMEKKTSNKDAWKQTRSQNYCCSFTYVLENMPRFKKRT